MRHILSVITDKLTAFLYGKTVEELLQENAMLEDRCMILEAQQLGCKTYDF